MVSPRSLAAFYVLVLCAIATSCAPSHRETTLRLDDPAAVYPLASHLQLAADPRGVLSPDEAAARALPSSAWRGRLDERVWLRIDLASAVDAEWGLSLAPPHDEATIYQTQGQGWLATQLRPRASSQWIPLALRRGRTVVLIRLARLSTAPPFFQLATREAHARAEQRFVFVQGLYFGVVALTVLLNLVVLRLRERAHSFYVLLVSLTATYFALRTGVASRFLVPALSREASLVPEVLALVLATAAATQFGRVFLGTARHAPRTDRVLRAHVALSLLVALCVPLAANPYAPAVVVGLSFPFAMLGAGLFAWRGGSRWAPLYLLAWGIFFLGALALVQPTILGGAVEPIVVLQLGSGVELLLLALALVLRLRILRGERREAEARAARAERLALLGKVAAGVIHEVNNPNNLVTFNLPLLQTYLRALTPVIEDAARREPSLTVLGMAPEAFFEDVASILQQMQHGSERITKITGELRSYINIGRGSPVWEDGDVNVAVERAIALVKRTHQLDNDALDARLAPKLPRLRMVPSHLERVIENLLVNAVQATASTTPRRIVVSTRVKAGALLLEVCDNGPGMTEEVQARLFEPFFTTRAASEGTGLGLAICEELVREHGGTIRASRDGQWTRLVVELAVAEGVMPDRVDGE